MWWTPARAVSTTISLLFDSTAAETEAQGATAKAEAPAATFRTARRSRLESVEIVLRLFMVSAPYAVRKKGYTKLRCARKGLGGLLSKKAAAAADMVGSTRLTRS